MRVTATALSILFLAFTLRVANLGGQSLWYDEAYTLLLARFPLTEMLERTARDTNQPLYFWLLGLWGTSGDFYPRFLSVAAGTASVALVFPVARSLLGERVALAAALFTAVSPFHVFYSQEVRMYALLGVWNLLAAWGFLRGRWVLYAAATTLALYTHVLGVLVPLAFLASALLRRESSARPAAIALVAAGLACLPWAGILAGQVNTVLTTFWARPPSPLSPFASLHLLFQGTFHDAATFHYALAATLVALAVTLPPVLARLPDVRPLGVLWAWAALPLLALLVGSLARPIYLERVVLGAAFPVHMLLGWTLTRGRFGLVLGIVVLITAAWGLKNWYTHPAFGKPPYREAAELVRSRHAGEPVLHTSDGSYLTFLLYAPELPNRLLEGDPEAAQNTSRARSTYATLEVAPVSLPQEPRFTAVISLDHSAEWQRGVIEDLDRRYRRLSEELVGGIIVRVYER